MEEFNLLPIYRNGLDEISDGIDIPVPKFCQGRCFENTKCREHYAKMQEAEEGIYKCPFGFASYVLKVNEENCIFTCLRVEDKYDKSKVIPKVKGESKRYREITYDQLLEYAQAYEEYDNNQNQYKAYRVFVEDIFHDIRKFNQQIKVKNDRIYRKSQQNAKYKQISELSKVIYVMSWFLTLRLNNHDFVYNEEMMKADVKTSYNMFKILDKVRHCIKHRGEEKNVTIQMEAKQSCRDMKAYDCIELLPFLLLDNAIKYSPENEKVDVLLEEKGSIQYVKIKSLGPKVNDGEIELLVNQGYRGEKAKQLTTDGMGIGLYTAKCIADLNEIELKLSSGDEIKKTKKGIDYSEFVVELSVKI